jgi:hypothetical protein
MFNSLLYKEVILLQQRAISDPLSASKTVGKGSWNESEPSGLSHVRALLQSLTDLHRGHLPNCLVSTASVKLSGDFQCCI